ncbi:MAG: hypothetical protein HQ536_00880, partial [Parcubacteria group bacterium]|nr:hypothetical protein [Parcubacteria group bacterium]
IIAGRIAAIVNDNHNKFYNDKVGFFGFFESVNDKDVSKLLFDTASEYLKENGINYKKIVSKRLLPDDAIFVIVNNTFFILEIKFQEVTGSTDEKLQTCDFKIKQYRKLLSRLNVEVEYVYILNDWFKSPKYKDVLDYIISIKGCSYYFNYLPLQKIGLPVPTRTTLSA